MLKVGITGGIGSGKSTVCRMLEESGIPVFYADRIAIEIEENNPAVRKALSRLLGKESYHESGAVNRPLIASKIFSSKKLQKAVEQIVHPAVMEEIDRLIGRLPRSVPLVAVEAALLFESGMHRRLDMVVVVDAPEDVRIGRVTNRDNVEPKDVRKRMAAQWSAEKKRGMADMVLGNDGSLEDLRTKVDFLLTLLRKISHGLVRSR